MKQAIVLSAKGAQALNLIDPTAQSAGPALPPHTLRWILPALSENTINSVTIVAGHEIESLGELPPWARIVYNRDWATTGMLESLAVAAGDLAGSCLITYGDILFDAETVRKVLDDPSPADFKIAYDSTWITRYAGRTGASRTKAEQVRLDGGRVHAISRGDGAGAGTDPADGEFAGILALSEKGAAIVRELIPRILAQRPGSALIDLLQQLIDSGHVVRAVDIGGHWAELDTRQDVAQYVFRSKAQALETIGRTLRSAVVLPQLRFTARDWERDAAGIRQGALEKFAGSRLAVRSSSSREDRVSQSGAGAFTSVLKVPCEDAPLTDAVQQVLASYAKDPACDADASFVLIQPYLENVRACGVLFTCDLRTGAPYLTVNYEESAETDGVTSGKARDSILVQIYRQTPLEQIDDPLLRQLVPLARELESLVGPIPLDIEFAQDVAGTLHVFQARALPITASLADFYGFDIRDQVEASRQLVTRLRSTRRGLLGDDTLLSNMTDWNPVEMIGVHPRPLAASLYDRLLMHSAWRRARAMIGYRDASPEKLMVLLAGRPFIDVRASFNSFVPAALPESIAHRLVNHYLAAVRANPELYDKVEFKVLHTCLTPDFEARTQGLRDAGFAADDLIALRVALTDLTSDVIGGEGGRAPTLDAMLELTRRMDRRRQSLRADRDALGPADAVHRLLEDCVELGTVPFAVLARYAFIATTLLESLVRAGALSSASIDAFMGSFSTVAGEIGQAFDAVREGRLGLAGFNEQYGHLRPGTYDILSTRYDETPELYITQGAASPAAPARKRSAAPPLAERGLIAVERALAGCGLAIPAEAFFAFAREAIKAREFAKFQFTKNVSDALQQVEAFGAALGLSREDCSYLRIEDVLSASHRALGRHARASYAELVSSRRREYLEQKQVIVPSLVFTEQDLSIVRSRVTVPNFITRQRVAAPVLVLRDATPPAFAELRGKIVLIETADPGYDWLFAHEIAGLVTKYGGAASHMAIRCAEFGLPAAIGCGERLFEQIAARPAALLDGDLLILRENG